MSRGVQSSADGSDAGTKAEYPSCGTSLPGMFAIFGYLTFLRCEKDAKALFSIFMKIENKTAGY